MPMHREGHAFDPTFGTVAYNTTSPHEPLPDIWIVVIGGPMTVSGFGVADPEFIPFTFDGEG